MVAVGRDGVVRRNATGGTGGSLRQARLTPQGGQAASCQERSQRHAVCRGDAVREGAKPRRVNRRPAVAAVARDDPVLYGDTVGLRGRGCWDGSLRTTR